MSVRRLLTVLAAALLGAAGGQVAPTTATAASGYCAKGTGVTVVVDNGPLGGGSSVRCDPSGANALGSTVVPRAGYPISYVSRQPGFVCRVAGLPGPSQEDCGATPPQDAYWGLFWSDGTSGRWSYASVGIGSLKVPAGGFIGWRFQGGGARTSPGPAPVSPRAATPTKAPSAKPPKAAPRPKPQPSARPSKQPSPRPSTDGPRPERQPADPASSSRAPAEARTGRSAGSTGPEGAAGAGPSSRPGSPEVKPSTAGSSRTGPSGAAPSAEPRRAGSGRAGSSGPTATRSTRASSPPSAPASPSASVSPTTAAPTDGSSPAGATSDDVDLAADERATSSSSVLPLVAGALVLALLGLVGALAWRRRKA